MNDIAIESSADAKWAELESRVLALEGKVASLPDAKQIEERVKASLPPPANPIVPPSFKDIEIPIPSVQNVIAAAKTTWTTFEVLGELQAIFWTLFDRRYHMAWGTRIITIALVILILTSHWWAPFWSKVFDLALGLVLFIVLNFETRR